MPSFVDMTMENRRLKEDNLKLVNALRLVLDLSKGQGDPMLPRSVVAPRRDLPNAKPRYVLGFINAFLEMTLIEFEKESEAAHVDRLAEEHLAGAGPDNRS